MTKKGQEDWPTAPVEKPKDDVQEPESAMTGQPVPGPEGYIPEPEEEEPPPGVEIKETYETLPVKLTDLDYKEYGIKMGKANQEIAAAEDALASVKSQFKARIDAAVAKRNEYSAIINSGVLYQKVDCHLVKDFIEGTITLVRLDTNEMVRTRTMGLEERQRGLKLEGESET